jgi:transposase-like protein
VKEDKESWLGFLRQLKGRGLQGTKLFIANKCSGLIESMAEVFPRLATSVALCTFTGMYSQ